MKIITLTLLAFFGLQNLFGQISMKADICIYGATSAGVIAAYTAKMQGKSVILLEASEHIGGLTTGGLGQTDIGNKYAITGLSRDLYRKVGKHYGKFEQWTFEPKVTSKVFNDYLQKAQIKVLTGKELLKVTKSNNTIAKIELLDENNQKITVNAQYFIDCSYEGDLMAMAGVSFTVGREDNKKYNELEKAIQIQKEMDSFQNENDIRISFRYDFNYPFKRFRVPR
jgi:flavin-dependent dehydrogenase